MLKASAAQDFETAAVLRDRMIALEKTLERQVTVTTDFLDRDVIAPAAAAISDRDGDDPSSRFSAGCPAF
jgi:excinuclease UvrABC nuclease subunit